MHRKSLILLVAFVALIGGLIAASRMWSTIAPPVLSFTEQCLKDGNMWHEMPPLRNGVALPGDKLPGCMTANGQHHFSDEAEYRAAMHPGESDVTFQTDEQPRSGEKTTLRFSVRDAAGAPPKLFREHERYLHVIIISRDVSVFSHVHPDDQPGFSDATVAQADFSVPYTFPKSGDYIIAVDYANQLQHESRQFHVTVTGDTPQTAAATFGSPQQSNGFTIKLDHTFPIPGEVTTLRFTVEKDGKPATDLVPYLGAAMHIAVLKNDLSHFTHTHGEVHAPGSPTPTPLLGHMHAPPPARFGPTIEAHVVFPDPGLYTIFTEFKSGDTVVPTQFSVRLE